MLITQIKCHHPFFGLLLGQRIAEGTEDGSGATIKGSFRQQMLPLLQRDLAESAEFGCSQIIHGPTAGLIKLPDAYTNINFVSAYRAPEDSVRFEWGSWAIGLEKWGQELYISFLVHYHYEI